MRRFLEQITELKNSKDFISPSLSRLISQVKTNLSSLGLNEQTLFYISSGSIGMTFFSKYTEVALEKASLSSEES